MGQKPGGQRSPARHRAEDLLGLTMPGSHQEATSVTHTSHLEPESHREPVDSNRGGCQYSCHGG